MPEYQKAFICPYRGNSPVLDKKFYVPFNPSEITIDEAIGVLDTDEDDSMEEIKNLLAGNFTGWQHPLKTTSSHQKKGQLVLSVTLFFNTLTSLYQDSYEDVRNYISQLYPYTNKTAEKNGKIEQIYFFWGSIAVAGVLSSMNVHYTMFAPDGKPVRAQVSISIRGDYVGEEFSANVSTSEKGETIGWKKEDISKWEDPSTWRSQYNGTGNPRL